jgi:hypothetical protein
MVLEIVSLVVRQGEYIYGHRRVFWRCKTIAVTSGILMRYDFRHQRNVEIERPIKYFANV